MEKEEIKFYRKLQKKIEELRVLLAGRGVDEFTLFRLALDRI
jgi:hypothetical protein